jgi:hypothetical protein
MQHDEAADDKEYVDTGRTCHRNPVGTCLADGSTRRFQSVMDDDRECRQGAQHLYPADCSPLFFYHGLPCPGSGFYAVLCAYRHKSGLHFPKITIVYGAKCRFAQNTYSVYRFRNYPAREIDA